MKAGTERPLTARRPSVSSAILRKYGAKRILLDGSLCRTGRFRRGSDIDLVVEGIRPQRFIRAATDLMMAMDWSSVHLDGFGLHFPSIPVSIRDGYSSAIRVDGRLCSSLIPIMIF